MLFFLSHGILPLLPLLIWDLILPYIARSMWTPDQLHLYVLVEHLIRDLVPPF